MIVHGSCHCDKVHFEIETEDPVSEVYRCNCSLCRRKSIVMKPVHESRFRLLAGAETLTLYQWNKRIAEHFFCAICGIYTHHRRRSAPDQISVNYACLAEVPALKETMIGLTDGAAHD